jgi:hypothetical protein
MCSANRVRRPLLVGLKPLIAASLGPAAAHIAANIVLTLTRHAALSRAVRLPERGGGIAPLSSVSRK